MIVFLAPYSGFRAGGARFRVKNKDYNEKELM